MSEKEDTILHNVLKAIYAGGRGLLVRLFEKDIQNVIDRITRRMMTALAGGSMVMLGIIFILFAALELLSTSMPLWEASLIIGLVALALGLVTILLTSRGK